MSRGEGGGDWEVANVPCLGEGGGAWKVANIVPCLGERGEGPGKWLMYHVQGRGGRGLGSG